MTAEELNQIGITLKKAGPLTVYHIENDLASAEVSSYGAHVLSFIPRGEKDILWVSEKCVFQEGKAIRGGIPVCWPWFGKAGTPGHGLARIAQWDLDYARKEADGSTTIAFQFNKRSVNALTCRLVMNAGQALTVSLTTTNCGQESYNLSEALHTYFNISEISKIRVLGLAKEDLPCEWDGLKDGVMTFAKETDIVCSPADKVLVIDDPGYSRKIRVERFGSNNSVVWNPWIDKSKAMSDFGDEEYHTMACVEAANALTGSILLIPGATHTLTTRISLI